MSFQEIFHRSFNSLTVTVIARERKKSRMGVVKNVFFSTILCCWSAYKGLQQQWVWQNKTVYATRNYISSVFPLRGRALSTTLLSPFSSSSPAAEYQTLRNYFVSTFNICCFWWRRREFCVRWCFLPLLFARKNKLLSQIIIFHFNFNYASIDTDDMWEMKSWKSANMSHILWVRKERKLIQAQQWRWKLWNVCTKLRARRQQRSW